MTNLPQHMMRNHLSIAYSPDDRWHGELTAIVHCEGFSGYGSSWFNRTSIEHFLSSLDIYPLQDGQELSLSGGVTPGGEGLIAQHLAIRLSPYGTIGRLLVRVHFISSADRACEVRQELTASFLTTYGDVANFRNALAAVLAGTADAADLPGEMSANPYPAMRRTIQ